MKPTFKELSTIILCFIFIICCTYREEIVNTVLENVIQNKTVTLPNESNNYNDFNFEFVENTNNFHVTSKQDMLNVIYTVLNHGIKEFTFYCDKDYENCSDDFNSISQDQALLSTINNMVSPYNSYSKIYFQITSYGKINMKIDNLYSNNEIKEIENKIEEFEKEYINDSMSTKDKIKAFHDYLINISTYDKTRANAIESGNDVGNSNSHKATGPLINNIALCSGYSDAMKIYLDKLKVPNYKVSTTSHIWNLIYIDNNWLHLDLTWDDPITSDGSNVLLHKFFLITTDELYKLDLNSHNYNKKYYPEIA